MSQFLKKPTVPIEVDKHKSINDFLVQLGNISFQARNLSNAADIWDRMLRDKSTILLGLAGAMVPAGMRKIVAYLNNHRFIDCIVSTGANLFHDCHETLGYYHWCGTPHIDDDTLFKEGIDRIYDTYAVESEFRKTDDFITDFSKELNQKHRYTTREFLYLLGKKLSEVSDKEGILTSAYKKDIPIYCPAIADSSIGIALAIARFRKVSDITFDMVKDILESADIVRESINTGVIYIGGGTPKNFIQQAMVTAAYLYTFKDKEIGHKYAIQITTDAPHWGGLSGCTLEEAKSWGKIAKRAMKISVYCDATIALPFLVAGLVEKEKKIIRGVRVDFEIGEELKIKVT